MRTHTDHRYQTIVQKVERVAREHIGETLHINFLCRVCNVSERTLRNAFRTVYSSTPYRYLRELRMHEARLALLQPHSSATTVTLVAMQYGFLELGRFSVEYRSAFGESPSATLRRSSPAYAVRFNGPPVDAISGVALHA
jgi:AraC-like DNA-binding protein